MANVPGVIAGIETLQLSCLDLLVLLHLPACMHICEQLQNGIHGVVMCEICSSQVYGM